MDQDSLNLLGQIDIFLNIARNFRKTSIGTYVYDPQRPHAVDQIHPPMDIPHNMPLREQTIEYTSFNKVSHIEELDGYEMDIEYGVGNQLRIPRKTYTLNSLTRE
ncbi:MAG: hypothetical protein KKA07_15055 [Bacteroidetes bacterium]|nr:hypothetical protein [Bacteroidota bacterium]